MYSRVELIVLNDNVGCKGLLNDWGWSVYVDLGRYKVLFDADTSPRVIEFNVEKLGVSIDELDFGFLSHHHRDHYGGYEYIGRARPGLTIYAPVGDVHYLSRMGLNPVIVEDPMLIVEGVWSTGSLSTNSLYEHGLVVETTSGSILIVGCSHPGVDRLARRAYEIVGRQLLIVIGGFHEPGLEELDRLAETTHYIAPTHCSGDTAKNYVSRKYSDRFIKIRTGSRIIVEKGEMHVEY